MVVRTESVVNIIAPRSSPERDGRCARVSGCPSNRVMPTPSLPPVRRAAALALAVCLLGAGSVRADTLKVVPLVREGQVLVSCLLADGYTKDVHDVIQSGLKTTFTYTVELRLKVPVWVDRVVDTATVTTTVQFDNLTRRHAISRYLDGRVEDAQVTEDEGVVRGWLTAFDKLPLFKTSRLEANREYYVVVRAAARPNSNVPFWPWGTSISGQTKFTFIP